MISSSKSGARCYTLRRFGQSIPWSSRALISDRPPSRPLKDPAIVSLQLLLHNTLFKDSRCVSFIGFAQNSKLCNIHNRSVPLLMTQQVDGSTVQ